MNDAGSSSPSIHVVLGISSVGKSEYIARHLQGDEARTVLAWELQGEGADAVLDRQASIVHYNMLLPWNNDASLFSPGLPSEPALAALLRRKDRLETTVLIARPATLARRTLLRDAQEPRLRPDLPGYPAKSVFEFMSRVPAYEVYALWFDLLEREAISFRIVCSDEDEYAPVATRARAQHILRSTMPVAYTPTERAQALGRFRYAYQRLDGIAEVDASGIDRTATLEAIKPYLAGSSVLDIGCGPGFFCFNLERLGFETVVGAEVKEDRFLAACALREVTASRCQFALRDVFTRPFSRTFDTVLLLNVLHHLSDPLDALRRAASMCTQRLIIEFATLADPKFAGTCPGAAPLDGALPLIGVSLSERDQTYLFTHEALRRICLDHATLFAGMEIFPSPAMPGRSIAICTK